MKSQRFLDSVGNENIIKVNGSGKQGKSLVIETEEKRNNSRKSLWILNTFLLHYVSWLHHGLDRRTMCPGTPFVTVMYSFSMPTVRGQTGPVLLPTLDW